MGLPKRRLQRGTLWTGKTRLLGLPRKQKSLQSGETQLHFGFETGDAGSVQAGFRGNDIVEEGRLADATLTPNDEDATHSATRDLKKAPEFLTLRVAAHEHGPMVAWLPLWTSWRVAFRATPPLVSHVAVQHPGRQRGNRLRPGQPRDRNLRRHIAGSSHDPRLRRLRLCRRVPGDRGRHRRTVALAGGHSVAGQGTQQRRRRAGSGARCHSGLSVHDRHKHDCCAPVEVSCDHEVDDEQRGIPWPRPSPRSRGCSRRQFADFWGHQTRDYIRTRTTKRVSSHTLDQHVRLPAYAPVLCCVTHSLITPVKTD